MPEPWSPEPRCSGAGGAGAVVGVSAAFVGRVPAPSRARGVVVRAADVGVRRRGSPSTPITTGESLLDPRVAGEDANEVNTPDDVSAPAPETTGTASTNEAMTVLNIAPRARRPLRERVDRRVERGRTGQRTGGAGDERTGWRNGGARGNLTGEQITVRYRIETNGARKVTVS